MRIIHYILSTRRIFGEDILNVIKILPSKCIEYKSNIFNIENSIFELNLDTSGKVSANNISLDYNSSEYPRSGMMNATVFYDCKNDILYVFSINRVYNKKTYIIQVESRKPDLIINSSIVASEENGSIITFKTALDSIKYELRDFISASGDVNLPYSDTIEAGKNSYFNNELTYVTGRGKLTLDIKNIFGDKLIDYSISTNLSYELINDTYIFNIDKQGTIDIVPNKIKKIFLFGESIETSLGYTHINVI